MVFEGYNTTFIVENQNEKNKSIKRSKLKKSIFGLSIIFVGLLILILTLIRICETTFFEYYAITILTFILILEGIFLLFKLKEIGTYY